MMRLSVATLTVAALAAPLLVQAQSQGQEQERPQGLYGTLGAGVGVVQEYDGGADTRTVPIGLFEIALPTRVGTIALGRDGLSWAPIENERLRAGIFASYDSGRVDDGDDNYRAGSSFLRGMGEIDETPEAGAFVGMNFGQLSTSLHVSHAVGSDGHDGMKALLSASLPLYQQGPFQLRAETSLLYADDKYTQTYFGVTRQQASRTRFAAYTADGGLNASQVGFTGTYALTPRWSIMAIASYKRLLGDAADSPIVQKRGYPEFALIAAWSWGAGQQ